jgi:hypothetical protein
LLAVLLLVLDLELDALFFDPVPLDLVVAMALSLPVRLNR